MGTAGGRAAEVELPLNDSRCLGSRAARPYGPGMTGTTSASALHLPRYLREDAEQRTPLRHPEYRSSALRVPLRTPVDLPHRLTEVTGPLLGEGRIAADDADLTRQHADVPLGQRIVVHGRVLDSDGRAVPHTLVEIWQANAAGRYRHVVDHWPAPLDPNFTGLGRALTDADGRYEFTTIKPGAYPWGNHHNAWRPAHIHFSVFGRAFAQRLVTQMYFPGDPLFAQDPIFQAAGTARERLVAAFDLDRTEPEWALAYRWDVVLARTPLEDA
jgi:protocatechuate 3,4-dioxygenase, beta subunit